MDDVRHEAEELRAPSPVDHRASWLRRRVQHAAVHPFALAQRSFNAAVLRVLDALSRRVDTAEGRAEAAERRMAELEERLLRLERRPASPAPETVAPQPRAAALPDYFAFESRLRDGAALMASGADEEDGLALHADDSRRPRRSRSRASR